MFALDGIETSYLILVAVGVVLAVAAMWRGARLLPGVVAIACALVIPFAGVIFVLAYGVTGLIAQSRSAPE